MQHQAPDLADAASLNRSAHLRQDAAFITRARADAASRCLVFWRGQVLLEDARLKFPPLAAFADAPWAFIGLLAEKPVFAVHLPDDPEPAMGAEHFINPRGLALLAAGETEILATSLGLLNWRRKTNFCPRCGGALHPVSGGWVLQCARCHAEEFPRIDAAVIMLVTRGDFLLLGQSHNFPKDSNFYSTLAGFVEPGESLEDAVRREVFEEVGVRVGRVAYHSSQPWPYPASLMLGFTAEALTENIVLEEAEMRDAAWFSRAQLRDVASLGFNLPPHTSIARRLIEDWLAGKARS